MGRFKDKPKVDPEAYEYRPWRGNTPSQSETAQRCMSKWWLNKIGRVEIVNTPKSQAIFDWGTAAHEQLEDILNKVPLRLMNHIDQPYVQEAHAFINSLVEIHEGVELEMVLPVTETRKVAMYGRIDLLLPGGLLDHKTTSGTRDKITNELAFCLNERNLGEKIQTNIYAHWWLLNNPGKDEVRVTLNYIQRSGCHKKPANWQVSVMFSRAEIKKNMIAIDLLDQEMYKYSQAHWDDVPINPDACKDFNTVCPYWDHCAKKKQNLNKAKTERLNNKKDDRMARLNAATLLAATINEVHEESVQASLKDPLEGLKEMYLSNDLGLGPALEAVDARIQVAFSAWRVKQIANNPIPIDSRPDHAPGEQVARDTGDVLTEIQACKAIPSKILAELESCNIKTFSTAVAAYSQEDLKAIKGIGPKAVKDYTAALKAEGYDVLEAFGKPVQETKPAVNVVADAKAHEAKVAAIKAKAGEFKSTPLQVLDPGSTQVVQEGGIKSITLSRRITDGNYGSIEVSMVMEIATGLDLDVAFKELVQDLGDKLQFAKDEL